MSEFFKVVFDLIGLSIISRCARIHAHKIPHVGAVPDFPPYVAATYVLIKGL